jgi:hypothetical protein
MMPTGLASRESQPGNGVAADAVGGEAQELPERFTAAFRPVLAFDPEEGEMAKAALQQMLGGHARNERVIDVDQREPETGDHPKDVHHRDAGVLDGASDAFVLDANDDAVAAPAFEPGRQSVVEAAGFVVERPRFVFTHMAGDAAEDVASGGQRGFHEEGHVVALA